MTVYVPLVIHHGPKAITADGEAKRVTFDGGALGALLVYETREAAEAAEPGAVVMEFVMREAVNPG